MAKQLVGEAKFQIPGGQATPAPPVGTALGKFGINLGPVRPGVQRRHARGERDDDPGCRERLQRSLVRVRHEEPSRPRSLLKKAAGIAKGSGVPNKTKVGTVTEAQLDEIATKKMDDLNARGRGARLADDRGHRPQHGAGGRGLKADRRRIRCIAGSSHGRRRLVDASLSARNSKS